MGTYNVHAGHCPQGKGASGAVGILQESVEDRAVKNEVIRLLRAEGIRLRLHVRRKYNKARMPEQNRCKVQPAQRGFRH